MASRPLPVVSFLEGRDLQTLETVKKFGFNPTIIAGNSRETVWQGADNGGPTIYQHASAPEVLTLTASNGAGGAGIEIDVQGLDADGKSASQVYTLDAGGSFTTTEQWLAVNRASNVGSVPIIPGESVSISGSGVMRAYLDGIFKQTNQTPFTVPFDRHGFVVTAEYSFGQGDDGGAFLTIREPGEIARARDYSEGFANYHVRELAIPTLGVQTGIYVPPGSQIEIRALSYGGTIRVGGTYKVALFPFPDPAGIGIG